MKSHEFIPEYEKTPRTERLEQQLRNLGYKRLGSGVDKTVWTKGGDSVVGILMPTTMIVNTAKRSLLGLMKLKELYPDNPHLPRFVKFRDESGNEEYYKEFKFEGKRYIQVGIERLYPIRDRGKLKLMNDIRVMAVSRKYFQWDDVWMRLKSTCEYLKRPEIKARINEVEPNMKLLWQTMKYIDENADRLRLFFDGLDGNVLQRKDGTPVITDPYYTAVQR